MIPKEAFIALALVMASAWAFGIFCDRMFIRWAESHSEPPEDADHDRWEEDPEPTNRCDTCRWEKVLPWDEEAHCSACDGYDGWEAIEK